MNKQVYTSSDGIFQLTKYQVSKVSELMCPICNGVLTKVFQLVHFCGICNISFVGERHVPAA